MPTTDANSPASEPRTTCPLCDAPLDPANPTECPKCDWVVGYRRRQVGRIGTLRDKFAVLFSVVPGLGHIYKGHRLLGAVLMLGSVFAFSAAFLAGAASAGWGFLLLPLYWGGVMLHAYWAADLPAQSATPRR